MTINTILLGLSIDPIKMDEKDDLLSAIQEVLAKFIPEMKEIHTCNFSGKGFLCIMTAAGDSFVTVRAFPQGLVSINIEYYKNDDAEPLLPFEAVRRLEQALTKTTGSVKSHIFPALKRGGRVDRYFLTLDERLQELDIDDVVFEENSPYHKVQILHSKSVGNILVLDDLPKISEKDSVYTEKLMKRGRKNYSGKEIVILGGGDGALLWEMLKENPKFVTMLESDETLIKACRKFMRACCGTCLDQYESSNYKIIVDVCAKSLDAMIESGRKVDYVFGDLTDIPVSYDGELWDFIKPVLDKSMQVLKSSGKYMTHSVSSPSTLAMYEEQLNSLTVPVEFIKEIAFVPTFLEYWVFFQVRPKLVD